MPVINGFYGSLCGTGCRKISPAAEKKSFFHVPLKRRAKRTHIFVYGGSDMKHPFFLAALKTLALFLAAAVLWACAGFKNAAGVPRYYPGVYEGIGQGFQGPVYLLVRIDTAGVTAIEILEHGDDEQIGGAAMEELTVLVLDAGVPDVDGISGATGSSTGFLAALEDALNRARMP
jgi:uncharacterized protein with FMN-binding domain